VENCLFPQDDQLGWSEFYHHSFTLETQHGILSQGLRAYIKTVFRQLNDQH
jgi:hypothetical protein